MQLNTRFVIYFFQSWIRLSGLNSISLFLIIFLKGIKILLPFYVTFIADRHVSETHGNTHLVQQELGEVLEAISYGLNRWLNKHGLYLCTPPNALVWTFESEGLCGWMPWHITVQSLSFGSFIVLVNIFDIQNNYKFHKWTELSYISTYCWFVPALFQLHLTWKCMWGGQV